MNIKTIINWSLLLILSIIWGSSFILMKKSLIQFTYLEVSLYRLIIAFIIFIPLAIPTIKKIKAKHIIPLLVVSLIGTVSPAIIFAKSQTYIESSLAGMLNSLTPIFTLILSALIFNKRWDLNHATGIIIGLTGTFMLLSPLQGNNINTIYSVLTIIATMFYAFSINVIKEHLDSLKPLDIAVGSSFFSAIIPFIYILSTGLTYNVEKIYTHISSFYYLIILGVMCTSFAIVLFNYLIKSSSALFASSTTYLIPIFAIIWGFLDFEIITNRELLGMAIILTGVFIMNSKD